MSKLRRYNELGKTYFITCVTYGRTPLLQRHEAEFLTAVNFVRSQIAFELIAWVVLPDHFHLIIEPLEGDLSDILKRIKLKFSGLYISRYKFKRGRVWQNRFWDHIIRDQNDMNRHIDYIHYNPVKHGLIERPLDHQGSSIHEYVQKGYYPSNWGVKEQPADIDGEFGE